MSVIRKKMSTKEKRTDDKFVKTKELFVLKTTLMKDVTNKTIEIPHFTLKMEDEDNHLKISSPKFKLAGKKFSIDVYPDYTHSGYIGVFLFNDHTEDQITSITIKEASGEENSWEMTKIRAGQRWGFRRFLSHEKYRQLAKTRGDVLRLDVEVTLHKKAVGNSWTRQCCYYEFHVAYKNIFRTKITSETGPKETFSCFGKTILEDDATADFTIRCETKELRVHKAVLCARSPVFRAGILTDMKEASKGEIFVEEIGEKTLATIINFIYTGELELGEKPDIQTLAWAGTKYLLPGFMDRLSLQVNGNLNGKLSGEMIADLLITAHRHESEDLRRIASDKIRNKREIFNDPGFRKGMKEADPSIMIDLVKDL